MPTITKSQRGTSRGTFSKLFELWRDSRTREAEAIVARYTSGRMSDAAEREMTQKLLHLGDSFRF